MNLESTSPLKNPLNQPFFGGILVVVGIDTNCSQSFSRSSGDAFPPNNYKGKRKMGIEMTAGESDRVKKLAGMLGSDFDGEIIAAARRMQEFAAKRNVPLADMLMAGVVVKEKVIQQTRTVYQPAAMGWEEPKSLAHGLSIALLFPDCLNDWEKKFARDVSGRHSLTSKQAQKAEQINAKVRTHAIFAGHAKKRTRPNL